MKKHPLLQLFTIIGSSKWLYIGAIVSLGCAVALETAGNLLIRYIIDDILIAREKLILLAMCGALFLVIALFRGLFFFLEGKGKAKTAENVAKSLRLKMYDHIMRLSFRFHDNTNSGELVQRSTSDIDAVRRFYMDQVPEFMKIVLLYAVNLSALLILEWRLALLATIITPFMVGLSHFFFDKIFTSYDACQDQEAHMTSRIQENLSGIRVVRAFARQKYEKQVFKDINDKQRTLGFKHIIWHNLYWPFAHMVCASQFVAVLIVGAYMVIQGMISPGTYVAFASMVNALIWPLQEFGRVITELSKSYVSYKRIYEILREEQEDLLTRETENSVEGAIHFKDLSFAYVPGNQVLRNINLRVKQGEKIALLGATGSGKTTLVNLLPRFYDYSEGEILLDSEPLKCYSRHELRRAIGIVEQEPFLFSMSVRDNIAYGAGREVSSKEVEEAAKAAAIHDSIMKLPDGYETEVGEKGVSLSGGQKQRITIARTLLKDPKILILDDSTSAVDANTEEKIRQALERLMKGRTTFIIAHRIQTLKLADRVVVLHDGQISQLGTHEELLNEEGFYREVFNLQTQIEDDLQQELIEAEAATA